MSESEPSEPLEVEKEKRDKDESFFRSVMLNVKEDRVNVAAGAFAFRWFLSIFPIIIALLGIAALVTIPSSVVVDLIHGVTKSLPSGAAQVFTVALSHIKKHSGAD